MWSELLMMKRESGQCKADSFSLFYGRVFWCHCSENYRTLVATDADADADADAVADADDEHHQRAGGINRCSEKWSLDFCFPLPVSEKLLRLARQDYEHSWWQTYFRTFILRSARNLPLMHPEKKRSTRIIYKRRKGEIQFGQQCTGSKKKTNLPRKREWGLEICDARSNVS